MPAAQQAPAQPPPASSYPPWGEDDNSSDEEDESESVATQSMPPPSDIPPPIPDCPPPISEFTSCGSISIDNSLSTFATDYCVGIYDYDATGSDEISFKAGDKIKILNRMPSGVDDGWWKGMVKSGSHAGKVGLFPSIICEPINDSDSEKTDGSLESPTSYSCAPPAMSPPKTPCLNNSLSVKDPMEIVVTAPTPTVQSPVAAESDHDGHDGEAPQRPPPVQPPRPVPPAAAPGTVTTLLPLYSFKNYNCPFPFLAAAPKLEKQVAQDIPQVVIQETLDEVSSPESEEQSFPPPPPPEEAKPSDEPKVEAKVEPSQEPPPLPDQSEAKFEAKFEANFDPPPSEAKEEAKKEAPFVANFEANFESPVKETESPPAAPAFEANFEANFEAKFEPPSPPPEAQPQDIPAAVNSQEVEREEIKFDESPENTETEEPKIATNKSFDDESRSEAINFDKKPISKSSSSEYSEDEVVESKKKELSSDDDKPKNPNPRGLQRVDTADSDSSDNSDSSAPAKEPQREAAKSDSDSDSSDHVPPEDLHVKQLKKLDTLKESSA